MCTHLLGNSIQANRNLHVFNFCVFTVRNVLLTTRQRLAYPRVISIPAAQYDILHSLSILRNRIYPVSRTQLL